MTDQGVLAFGVVVLLSTNFFLIVVGIGSYDTDKTKSMVV